jgi:hypothetical protein
VVTLERVHDKRLLSTHQEALYQPTIYCALRATGNAGWLEILYLTAMVSALPPAHPCARARVRVQVLSAGEAAMSFSRDCSDTQACRWRLVFEARTLRPCRTATGLCLPGLSANPAMLTARPGRRWSAAASARLAGGGRANRPSSLGIGADPGHQEHRSPSTRADRGQRMPVDRADIHGTARPAAWAEDTPV